MTRREDLAEENRAAVDAGPTRRIITLVHSMRLLDIFLVSVLAVALGLAIADVHRIWMLPERLPIALPHSVESLPDSQPETWLILGTDSADPSQSRAHAEVALLLQTGGERASIISIPHDLELTNASQGQTLASTLERGPQNTVNVLCESLSVRTDHLIVITMDQFASLIDVLGGITLDIPTPMRDTRFGLHLPTAGRVRVDGATALALVRAGHLEYYRDGRWAPVGDRAEERAEWAAQVMRAVGVRFERQTRSFVRGRSLADSIARAISVDDSTTLLDTVRAARSVSAAVRRGGLDVHLVEEDRGPGGGGAESVLEGVGYSPGTCRTAAG